MRTSGACCSSRCDESSARHFEKRRLGSAHRGTAEIQRKRMAATRAQRQRWHSRGHSQRHSSVRVGHVAADRPRWSHCCTRAKGACETSRLAGGEATAASSSSLASTAELPAAQCAKSHQRSWGLISCELHLSQKFQEMTSLPILHSLLSKVLFTSPFLVPPGFLSKLLIKRSQGHFAPVQGQSSAHMMPDSNLCMAACDAVVAPAVGPACAVGRAIFPRPACPERSPDAKRPYHVSIKKAKIPRSSPKFEESEPSSDCEPKLR